MSNSRSIVAVIFTGLVSMNYFLPAGRCAEKPIPPYARQLVVVVNKHYENNQAWLIGYERTKTKTWQPVLGPFPAIIGKRGLAWGRGLHQATDASLPIKKEGDKCSPAGVFELGPVIGRPINIPGLRMPYISLSQPVECVDDPNSRYYNRLVLRDTTPAVDWKSSERLFLPGIWYDLGVVVNHNSSPAIPGTGSCIFLHNWDSPSDSTTGCTALAPENLAQLIYWLDEEKVPILVQLPIAHYHRLKNNWDLPQLPKIIRIGKY